MRSMKTRLATPAVTLLTVLSSTLLVASPALAEVAVLTPSQDNTLYESAAGDVSNSAGESLFAGRIALGDRRRALLAFDVAGAIPAGATIDAVTLTLNVTAQPPGAMPIGTELYRVLADWGEGASDAPGPEGMGGAAAPGDATWLHTFFPNDFWATVGGDFVPAQSANAVANGLGPITWGSTPQMVADVQDWLDDPAGNFGWMIQGGEIAIQTARRFDSREDPDPTARPQLMVEYTARSVIEVPTLSQWGLIAMTVLLLAAGAAHLRRRKARVSC